LCEGFPGKFICEMCGNLNIVSRREKTKKMETTAKRA